MSEYDHQCAVVSWFKRQYPEYRECIFAIPNGSFLSGDKVKRGKQMNRLKKEGLKVGVSDLFIAVPLRGFHGMFIEMKDEGKTACSVSESQKRHISVMKAMKYKAGWCAGFDSAREFINDYMATDFESKKTKKI